jgi:tetratricopeptide (TPR) repeat protein
MKGQLNWGLALIHQSRFQEALPPLERAAVSAEMLHDGDSQVRALAHAAIAYEALGEWDRSRNTHLQVVTVAESLGSPNMIVFSLRGLGWVLFREGKWDQARTHWERAAALTDPSTSPWYGVWPRIALAELCLHQGKWDESTRFIQESVIIAERAGGASVTSAVQRLQAMQALLEVQPSEAEHLLERAAEMAECSVEDSLVVLAESHLETGAVDRAATLIDELYVRRTRRITCMHGPSGCV